LLFHLALISLKIKILEKGTQNLFKSCVKNLFCSHVYSFIFKTGGQWALYQGSQGVPGQWDQAGHQKEEEMS
jgi:hypothetical protein